jgi:hypothetical protein
MKPSRKAPRPAAAAAAAPSAAATGGLLDPQAPYLVPLLLLVLSRGFLATRITFAAEDALITFRYAWNWAHGLGPVFNAGERVFGFTSPPWMAWIALGMKVGLDPLVWARLSLGLADVVTLLALTSLLEKHASRASAWCFAIFFAGWTYFGALACSGLESGILVALVAATAWLVDRRHPAAGVTLGLLAVIRPEGLLAAAVLAVWASWRDRAIAAGIVALELGVLAAYYGSPVPQSVVAKQVVYGAPGLGHAMQWWFWMVPVPMQAQGAAGDTLNLQLFALLMFPAAVAGAIFAWQRRTTAWVAALAALAVVWMALLVVGASYFFWYLAAPAVMWALLASAGMPRIARGWVLYATFALAIALHWLFEPMLYSGRSNTEGYMFGAVGDYIASHAKPGESVLLEPIGTIGWHNRSLKIIDEVGLVSPAATAARREGPGWYARLLERQRPDWLVARASLIKRGAAFAGVGAPFRDTADQVRALAPYDIAAASDTTQSDQSLVVLRRRATPR